MGFCNNLLRAIKGKIRPNLYNFMINNPKTLVLGYDDQNGYISTKVDSHIILSYQGERKNCPWLSIFNYSYFNPVTVICEMNIICWTSYFRSEHPQGTYLSMPHLVSDNRVSLYWSGYHRESFTNLINLLYVELLARHNSNQATQLIITQIPCGELIPQWLKEDSLLAYKFNQLIKVGLKYNLVLFIEVEASKLLASNNKIEDINTHILNFAKVVEDNLICSKPNFVNEMFHLKDGPFKYQRDEEDYKPLTIEDVRDRGSITPLNTSPYNHKNRAFICFNYDNLPARFTITNFDYLPRELKDLPQNLTDIEFWQWLDSFSSNNQD